MVATSRCSWCTTSSSACRAATLAMSDSSSRRVTTTSSSTSRPFASAMLAASTNSSSMFQTTGGVTVVPLPRRTRTRPFSWSIFTASRTTVRLTEKRLAQRLLRGHHRPGRVAAPSRSARPAPRPGRSPGSRVGGTRWAGPGRRRCRLCARHPDLRQPSGEASAARRRRHHNVRLLTSYIIRLMFAASAAFRQPPPCLRSDIDEAATSVARRRGGDGAGLGGVWKLAGRSKGGATGERVRPDHRLGRRGPPAGGAGLRQGPSRARRSTSSPSTATATARRPCRRRSSCGTGPARAGRTSSSASRSTTRYGWRRSRSSSPRRSRT